MTRPLATLFGGTGFVGQHLSGALIRAGYRVRIPTRHPQRHRECAVSPHAEVVPCREHTETALAAVVADSTVVVNLIGILNGSAAGFRAVHVDLARRIAEATRAAGAQRLLHMSAINADPQARSTYLKTKGEGENAVHAVEGLAVTSFRPSIIFGRGDSFFNRFATLLQINPGPLPLACARAKFAPVFVGDLATLMVATLGDARSTGERLEVCGPGQFTLQQLVAFTADQIGVHRGIIPLGNLLSYFQALALNWAPGRPFTLDNFRSLQSASVCTQPLPDYLPVPHASVEAVVPGYLGEREINARYCHYRMGARR